MADLRSHSESESLAAPTLAAGDSLVIRDVTARARALPGFDGHEQVLLVRDEPAGLTAIIAIHDTTLGSALGGCRIRTCEAQNEAFVDALRLSRAMSYKSALAGVEQGGGKAVILGDPRTDKTQALFTAFAAALDRLGGRFVTGQDAGMDVADIDALARLTRHVVGSRLRGAGDPSPHTAVGVHAGLQAAARHRLNSDTLSDVTVAVQGVGHVGAALCERLAADGARLVVCDVEDARLAALAARLGAEIVAPEAIHRQPADIFAPCALGGVVDAATIAELRCAVVAGSANNPLADEALADDLRRRGILYAPDFVINAGGLLHVSAELDGRSRQETERRILAIGATLTAIFEESEAEGLPTNAVAEGMARRRLARAAAGRRC